jgi:hypothetical protein
MPKRSAGRYVMKRKKIEQLPEFAMIAVLPYRFFHSSYKDTEKYEHWQTDESESTIRNAIRNGSVYQAPYQPPP